MTSTNVPNLPSLTDLEAQSVEDDAKNPRASTFNQSGKSNGIKAPAMSDPERAARLQEMSSPTILPLSTPRRIEVKVLEMQASMNQLQLQLLALGGDANAVSKPSGMEKYRYDQDASVGSDSDCPQAPGAVRPESIDPLFRVAVSQSSTGLTQIDCADGAVVRRASHRVTERSDAVVLVHRGV
jgi:hypothetical protein